MCKCGSLYPPSGWTMKSFMFLLQPLELIDLVIQRKLMFLDPNVSGSIPPLLYSWL